MHSLKPLLRQLYTILPTGLRYRIDITTISLRDTLSNWCMPAYRVHAVLPSNEGEGTIIYFGDKPQYASWTHKLFGRDIKPVSLGRFSLYQILSGKNQALTADISLCPLNPLTLPLFRHYQWHQTPLFINCHVNLDKPLKALFNTKGANEDLRVARRTGYSFSILKKDDHAIHEFFYKMMLPTIKNRHEQRAFLSEWENIKRIYQHGFLAAAYSKNEWIGAILISIETSDCIRLANMGWRNGDEQWLKNGIVAALINYSFNWAINNGYTQVNMGSSNPFANDGPLNFKLKWGATLSVPELSYTGGNLEGIRSFIGIKLNLSSPATQLFLASTPLFEYTKDKINVIGWNAEIPPLFRRQLELGVEWINLADTATFARCQGSIKNR